MLCKAGAEEPLSPCPFLGWLLPSSICSGKPRLPLKQRGALLMWFGSGEKGFSGKKEGVCSSRGAFRNTPVAAREGPAVTTSLGVRVQKSIVFLTEAMSQQKPRCAAEKAAKIYSTYSTTERSSLVQNKGFSGGKRSIQDMPWAISFPKNRVLMLPLFSMHFHAQKNASYKC